MGRKLTQKEVLDRFKKVHGDEYDYSLVLLIIKVGIQMLKLYVQKMVMGYLHKDPQNILEVKDVQIVE